MPNPKKTLSSILEKYTRKLVDMQTPICLNVSYVEEIPKEGEEVRSYEDRHSVAVTIVSRDTELPYQSPTVVLGKEELDELIETLQDIQQDFDKHKEYLQ